LCSAKENVGSEIITALERELQLKKFAETRARSAKREEKIA